MKLKVTDFIIGQIAIVLAGILIFNFTDDTFEGTLSYCITLDVGFIMAFILIKINNN